MVGIRYFGGITLRIIMKKLFGNKDDVIQFSNSNVDNRQAFDNTYWFGIHAIKCPLDLWVYQELIYKTKPDFIIETGTNEGGSALFLANICELLNHGEIITVDIASVKDKPKHKRINYLQGNSVSTDTINQIKNILDKKTDRKVMVILDDDH